MSASANAEPIRWGVDGLATVVTVDAASGDVLMVASMNAEALARTRQTGVVHYWSRSRNALWRKGATSGHEQRLVEIRVNCNEDSLLLRVEQGGAVCHDGYQTCYYRRLESDDSLTVIGERAFDPAAVYGESASPTPAALVRQWFGAYAALRDEDHEAVSGTSRRLRAEHGEISTRLADELDELAGVLDGSHRHRSFAEDVALEATQCLYWVVLMALRLGVEPTAFESSVTLMSSWDMSRAKPEADIPHLLRTAAAGWKHAPTPSTEYLTGTIALVAIAARRGGHHINDLIASDLADLQTKPYLAAYFHRFPNEW